MDKNTLNGLLLMFLVFALFMWLTPKQENTPAQDGGKETKAEVAAAAGIDSLTATEQEWLVQNISANGKVEVAADSSRIYTLRQGDIDLQLRGDSVTGTVTVGGRKLAWSDVKRADLNKMSVPEQRQAVEMVRNASTSLGKYGKFAQFLSGTSQVIKLENDALSIQLDSKSGSVVRAELKKYESEYSSDETKKTVHNVVVFEGKDNQFNFMLPLPQPIETSELYFTPEQLNDSTVLMALKLAPDVYWGIEYTLPRGESYVVKMRVVQKNMAQVVQSNNRNLGFTWNQRLHRQEKGRMFEERNSALYFKYAGGKVENLKEAKDDSEEHKTKIKWIGFKNQFFSTVMVAEKPFNTADFDSKVMQEDDYLKEYATSASSSDYDWNAENPANFSLFIGPNLYPLLSDLDNQIATDEDLKMTRLIPLGWNIFRWINTGIVIPVFTFLGKFIGNYGIIILLLTLFIKLILFPLTYKSYRSQAVMRILAPDIKAINEKYPGTENALTRNQKTMALYSQAGASPMSGCLPMLLQMPVLFAMFSFFPSCIELRGESFLWAHDLSAPDAIISWNVDIPLITKYFGNHISLFCLLMTGTNIIYTYLNMQNQSNAMPGMKWMMYLMPVMFMVFFNNYASGLSYYYFLSLLITIIQTYAFRFIIKEDKVRAKMRENAKKPKKKSGFMARLEEMQRQQQAMLREQQKKGNRR